MNRRTVALVALAVAAVGVAAVAAYGPLDLSDDEGTADAAEPPRFVHEGEQLTVEPAEGQTIRGETELDAGTELQIRLRSTGENPFLKSATATVEDDGTFEATYDMSGIDDGTTFDVVVHRDGERFMNTTGEVVA